VKIDTVEPGFLRKYGAAAELLDDLCKFVLLECTRHGQFILG
jgi:hypothetical protein